MDFNCSSDALFPNLGGRFMAAPCIIIFAFILQLKNCMIKFI